MAKPSSNQLFPSVGVLVAAILAAFFAVVLVNVYIKSQIDRYRKGSVRVLQLREDVLQGDQIRPKHLMTVEVPQAFEESFQSALKAGDEEVVIGKTAPRLMRKGEVLFSWEFLKGAGGIIPVDVRPGYELVTLPIDKGTSPGPQLQPGSFITVYGEFDTDPDPKKADIKTFVVIASVQVRTVGGRTTVDSGGRAQAYDEVGVEVRESQAQLLMRVRNVMTSNRYTITLTSRPERTGDIDPKVNDEVVEKFLKGTTGTSAEFPLN